MLVPLRVRNLTRLGVCDIMASPVHTLELKIPPVALAVIVALTMWGASLVSPAIRLPFAARAIAAAVFALMGSGISLAGVAAFRRAKTTVNPTMPGSASTLVRSGIYRVSRNPMYLGFLLILLGWAAFLASPVALILVGSFVIYMNAFQIRAEERALTAIFGNQFAEYTADVRRWL